jgi:hypothetical protein
MCQRTDLLNACYSYESMRIRNYVTRFCIIPAGINKRKRRVYNNEKFRQEARYLGFHNIKSYLTHINQSIYLVWGTKFRNCSLSLIELSLYIMECKLTACSRIVYNFSHTLEIFWNCPYLSHNMRYCFINIQTIKYRHLEKEIEENILKNLIRNCTFVL